MWHHAAMSALKYTTSVDIQKRAIKLVIHVEPHASAVSLLKWVENSAIQAIINKNKNNKTDTQRYLPELQIPALQAPPN